MRASVIASACALAVLVAAPVSAQARADAASPTETRADGAAGLQTRGGAAGLRENGAAGLRENGAVGLRENGAGGLQTPGRAGGGVGVRVFFLLDRVAMSAADSFKATLDSSSLSGFGGGVDVTRLWKGLFLRAAFSSLSGDGERVVVVNGDAIPLDVPLEVKMMPLEIGGGWRAPLDPSRRAEAYGGGGLLRLSYKESSPGADADENLDESFNGTFLFGGVDFDLSNGFMAGFEAQFRSVPDAIGQGGVSREFEETNLGGFAIRFVVGFRK